MRRLADLGAGRDVVVDRIVEGLAELGDRLAVKADPIADTPYATEKLAETESWKTVFNARTTRGRGEPPTKKDIS